MSKNKNIIMIGITLIVIVLVVIGITFLFKKSNTKQGEGYKSNTNENVIKEQVVGSFKFTNVSLNYQDGNSVLRVSVTNVGVKEELLNEFKIHIFDKENKEIVALTGFIGDSLASGETKYIESSYADDLTEAERIEYEILK